MGWDSVDQTVGICSVRFGFYQNMVQIDVFGSCSVRFPFLHGM